MQSRRRVVEQLVEINAFAAQARHIQERFAKKLMEIKKCVNAFSSALLFHFALVDSGACQKSKVKNHVCFIVAHCISM